MSLRILCFADARFPLERANGIQTFETCAALARRGHEVELLARPDTARPSRDPFDYYGVARDARLHVSAVAVAGPPALRRAASLAQALVRSRRAAGGDLVLTRDLGFARLYLRTRGRGAAALVYESHGYAPTVSEERPAMLTGARPPSDRKQARLAARERAVWREADGYVTITRGLADELQDRLGARPALAVVPDGARVPASRRPRRPGAGPPVVGYSGHLYPWKGVDLLIEALADVPSAHGLIVGGHPGERDLARLQARARDLGLASRVRFTGMVPPREVAGHLEGADVLVLPNPETAVSARYTSPLKLFEYLAMGRPIVASDLPAFREVIEDGRNGVLFQPGNRAALARAITAVLADADGAELLGRQAFETAREYSWDRRAERLESLFAEAVARRAARTAR